MLFIKKKKAATERAVCGSAMIDNKGFNTKEPDTGITTKKKEEIPSKK